MSFECNLLISLLKLTQNGPVKQENVKTDAKLPSSVTSMLLKKLQNEQLIYVENDLIHVNAQDRIKLAVKAAELGADVERVGDVLSWQEFEAMAAVALEPNGYTTQTNVRFKHGGRRWEIDVVGCRKPLVLCIDCKRWRRGMHPSTIEKVAASQAERVAAFADSLPIAKMSLPCVKWDYANFVPVILSLVPFRGKFCDDIPIVPVLQLQDFVNQLPLYVESLRYFRRQFNHL
ncbi:MAG: restriction endonuclease [Candidatus Bathyarchaeota archaeon]|nr:restriction endonuclease [Candidatus Bathyarchaeota archaeon]